MPVPSPLSLVVLLFTLSTVPRSTASSHSSSSTSSSSSFLEREETPILTLSTSSPYLCIPTTPCLPCSPEEMNTPLCSIWGNKRHLSCTPYDPSSKSPLFPHPIKDPDEQQSRTDPTTLLGTTTIGGNSPSQFYEYEPGKDSKGYSEGEEGLEGEGGVGTSREDREEVLAELRDVLNAERRRNLSKRGNLNRRNSIESSEEGENVVFLEKRQEDGRGRIMTWEACPKVVKREQSDYFEFVLCNLFFALAGLAVLLYRQRTLAGRQFGKLVARIMQTEIR
ncbi:hypothetical protein JCM16303_000872 [Sporobolomyces ruberrimus]